MYDGKNDRHYQFDGVLSEDVGNKDAYKIVAEPLVFSALNGFNGILMCYGQTGTGLLLNNWGLTNLKFELC